MPRRSAVGGGLDDGGRATWNLILRYVAVLQRVL